MAAASQWLDDLPGPASATESAQPPPPIDSSPGADRLGRRSCRPSLFERLMAAENGQLHRLMQTGTVTESIGRNLRAALNGHAGGAATRPDWGLSDFSDLAMRKTEMAPRLADEIRRQIQAFEPRLRRVEVRHEPERERFMTACFHIDAQLASGDAELRVSMGAEVAANGTVRVD